MGLLERIGLKKSGEKDLIIGMIKGLSGISAGSQGRLLEMKRELQAMIPRSPAPARGPLTEALTLVDSMETNLRLISTAGNKGMLSKLVSDQREKAVERLQKALQKM